MTAAIPLVFGALIGTAFALQLNKRHQGLGFALNLAIMCVLLLCIFVELRAR